MADSRIDDDTPSVKSLLVPRQPNCSNCSSSSSEAWRSPLQYTDTLFVHPLEHPMNQLYEGVFKCPLCTTASFNPCGFKTLQQHYFDQHFSKRVNLAGITAFPCRCPWGGKSDRPIRRVRTTTSESPISRGRSQTSLQGTDGSPSSSAGISPGGSARSLRRQRRTPDRFGEDVAFHYHCPYCEHSSSASVEEILIHVRAAHRLKIRSSIECCESKREMGEVTLVDPLSPSRPHQKEEEEEGSAKKVRFSNHVRVKLMDSDASRVEKLGSVLGDPKKEVLTRGWLTAAVESAVGGMNATLYGTETDSDMIDH